MRVEFSDEFYKDIERIREHILASGGNAVARMDEIFEALKILRHSPYIGRPAEAGQLELVVGNRRRSRGNFALYDVCEDFDGQDDAGLVTVNAIRSQHESGCY